MQESRRVFKPGLLHRVIGCALMLSFGGVELATLVHVALHYAQLPTDELWSAFGTCVFFLPIAVLGAAVLHTGFGLGPDYIEVLRPRGTRHFAAGSPF